MPKRSVLLRTYKVALPTWPSIRRHCTTGCPSLRQAACMSPGKERCVCLSGSARKPRFLLAKAGRLSSTSLASPRSRRLGPPWKRLRLLGLAGAREATTGTWISTAVIQKQPKPLSACKVVSILSTAMA